MGTTRHVQVVLVVDDDPSIRVTYRDRFAQAGKRVHAASNSREALEIAACERPDLAVVDLRLGGEWGLTLVEKLRAEIPELEVALVSAYMCDAAARAAVGCGAAFVFGKPLRDAAVTILGYVEGRTPCVDWSAHGFPTLDEANFEHIMSALTECGGNVTRAAALLGVKRQSLQQMLAKPCLPRWVHALSGDDPHGIGARDPQ